MSVIVVDSNILVLLKKRITYINIIRNKTDRKSHGLFL